MAFLLCWTGSLSKKPGHILLSMQSWISTPSVSTGVGKVLLPSLQGASGLHAEVVGVPVAGGVSDPPEAVQLHWLWLEEAQQRHLVWSADEFKCVC